MIDRIRKALHGVAAPLATSSAGLGGIVFHAGHGTEHLFCILIATLVAVGGAIWSFRNRAYTIARFKERR